MEQCYHCGEDCRDTAIVHEEKNFCCQGCRTVYDILNENDLEYYYTLQSAPGQTPKVFENKFDFLDNQDIVEQLLEFNEQDTQIVSFVIPKIHCSSCIWILENLHKLHPGVKVGMVNFPQKTVRITYDASQLSLKELVLLLNKIGYEPNISLEDFNKKEKKIDRSLIYKLGVAGFAFGNIMFLSFPEYFEVSEFWLDQFKPIFRWLMFAFSVPVVFYSGRDYFVSAFKGLRSGILNINVPIAIGILVLFLRSTLEIVMDWGTGFFDSLAGLVFFLLLGKFFQQKTYSFLSFERDYKSYFPIAVTQLVSNDKSISEIQTQVYQLKAGDRILIRNSELIPTDGVLIEGKALIDYSFVTGEAEPVNKVKGDKIFAGGKQQAGIIEMEVSKAVAQSYLTQLWNNEIFSKNKSTGFNTLTDQISRRFTVAILSIAVLATIFWFFKDISIAFNVFTAVLIVACPCAIALAAPFTLGNMLRIFGKHKLYLKDTTTIEQMAQVDTVVFDKTGTLTKNEKNKINYEGQTLTENEQSIIVSTLRSSNHPLSRALYVHLKKENIQPLDNFTEETGKGITGTLGDLLVKIGSNTFVNNKAAAQSLPKNTQVHLSINGEYKGHYDFSNTYRDGMQKMFSQLSSTAILMILSGDNDGEQEYLKSILPLNTILKFNQKPEDKLAIIKNLQEEGKKVMMVGDGLNDAGALAQSNVGIAISEDVNVFSPACDGIMDASILKDLNSYVSLSHKSIRVIKQAFIFSLFYNLVGLSFAVTGNLAPVIAAILMPLSSISIVVFTTLSTHLISRKLK